MAENNRNISIIFNVVLLLFCIWASASLGNSSLETNAANVSKSQTISSYKYSQEVLLPGNSFFPELNKTFIKNLKDSKFYFLQLNNEAIYSQMQRPMIKELKAVFLRIRPEQIFRSLGKHYYNSQSFDYPEIS